MGAALCLSAASLLVLLEIPKVNVNLAFSRVNLMEGSAELEVGREYLQVGHSNA